MDPFIHGTISALAIVRKTGWSRQIWSFIFFGVLPDIYGIITLALVILGLKSDWLDDNFFAQYNITHSILVFLLVSALVSLCLRKIYWPFSMYGLHIVVDMLSHQITPTPWLWPLSDFTISGWFEYTEPTVFLITYAIVVPVWAFIYLNKKIRVKN